MACPTCSTGGVRPQRGPGDRGTGRRAQHPRLLDQRRRRGPGPLTDERGPGRPGPADHHRAGRVPVERCRRRGAGVRAGADRWPRLDDRNRRLHARRGDRLAGSSLRADVRQPDRRPTSSPRTDSTCTSARTSTRSCCGPCAAAVATSASSPRSSSGRTRLGPRSSPASSSTGAKTRRRCSAVSARRRRAHPTNCPWRST